MRASRESVMNPGQETRIHFDIHQNVRWFTNHQQLQEELNAAIERNRDRLLTEPAGISSDITAMREALAGLRADVSNVVIQTSNPPD